MTVGPAGDRELERQRVEVEAVFREQWAPLDTGPRAEVIIIGNGPGRRVAVLFPHGDFPGARFGHRFDPVPSGGTRAARHLVAQIKAGALHRMMENPPLGDGARIIWTTWGTPNSDAELDWQRATIAAAFREGWRPSGAGAPPLQSRPFITNVTDAEVILSGSDAARRVAVLFCHGYFPGVRFGHRFPLDPFARDYESIWLKEEIETGALHRMMADQPPADGAGVIWTIWGSPLR